QRLGVARARPPRRRPPEAAALSRAGVAMSHFLERLVARSTGRTVVRPRAVGRFELGPWADPVPAVAEGEGHAPVGPLPRTISLARSPAFEPATSPAEPGTPRDHAQ